MLVRPKYGNAMSFPLLTSPSKLISILRGPFPHDFHAISTFTLTISPDFHVYICHFHIHYHTFPNSNWKWRAESKLNMENVWKPQVSKWNQHENQGPKVEMGWKFIAKSGNVMLVRRSPKYGNAMSFLLLTSPSTLVSILYGPFPHDFHAISTFMLTISTDLHPKSGNGSEIYR